MDQLELAIKSTKLLFAATAMNSITENLYHSLVEVCENPSEEFYKRKGAGFWANEIVKGFIAFERLRIYCNENNVQDTKRPLALKTMTISKEVQKAYKKLRIDTNKTLVFGDSLKRPWRLTFDRNYILERMEQVNEFSADVVKSCFDLVKPSLTEEQIEELVTLVDVKIGNSVNEIENRTKSKSSDKIYDLSDLENAKECNYVKDNDKSEKFGLWTKETGDWNWSECPIGTLPWE